MAEEKEIKIEIKKEDDRAVESDGGSEKSEEKEASVPKKEAKETKEANPTILLMDDDQLILDMYRKKLENDGFTVKTALNGDDVLMIAKDKKPDVIFLDVVVAGMNGAEILKELKKNPKTKDIPVIMLTNFSDKQEDIEGAKKSGALDYLIKAKTTPKDLSERARRVITTGE